MKKSPFFNSSLNRLYPAVLLAASMSANAFVITEEGDANVLSDQLFLNGTGVTITNSSLDFGVPSEFGEGFPGDGGGEVPGDGGGEVPGDGGGKGPGDSGVVTGSQTGLYTNNEGTYGLPGPGVVLSTGNVSDYETGPNLESGTTSEFGNQASTAQNDLLSPLTGEMMHFDPVQLDITFDVDSSVTTISFFASFGSEEYPEYVNGGVNDGFGMIFNGENIAGILPTGGTPGVDPLLPINIDNPEMATIPGTELDGVLAPNGSPILRFDVPVTPGSTGNTFSIILADTGDSVVDTTIYLSSFGNFDSKNGSSEFTPILPDANNPTTSDGAFVFNLPELNANQTVWIDPDVAVGYTYEATGGGLFASVTAPSLLTVNDADGYILTYNDGVSDVTVVLAAGEQYYFGTGVSTFTIEGINPELLLDPTDPTVFVTGVSFTEAGTFGVTQLPLTSFYDDGTGGSANVPEPATYALLFTGLMGLVVGRRRKKI